MVLILKACKVCVNVVLYNYLYARKDSCAAMIV